MTGKQIILHPEGLLDRDSAEHLIQELVRHHRHGAVDITLECDLLWPVLADGAFVLLRAQKQLERLEPPLAVRFTMLPETVAVVLGLHGHRVLDRGIEWPAKAGKEPEQPEEPAELAELSQTATPVGCPRCRTELAVGRTGLFECPACKNVFMVRERPA